jgi:broad specificity phosphatase PhoE
MNATLHQQEQPVQQPTEALQSNPEILQQVEALWNDPSIVSYSLRRHGNYERDRNSNMRGSLTPESIQEVKEHAQTWANRVPEESEVAIYQSPSFMPAKQVNKLTGEEKVIKPMRATITASLYERAIFGNLKATKNEAGEGVSARRTTESRLGDFLETATSAEGVGRFYEVLGETYRGLSGEFWGDYIHDTLDPRVDEAIRNCGGKDSIGLAENVATFIEETHTDHIATKEDESKRAILAVTHGESMRAFTYFVGKYLESTHTADAETIQAFHEQDYGYNEGIDVHVTADKVTIVVANKHAAALKLNDFKEYLTQLQKEKEERNASESVS